MLEVAYFIFSVLRSICIPSELGQLKWPTVARPFYHYYHGNIPPLLSFILDLLRYPYHLPSSLLKSSFYPSLQQIFNKFLLCRWYDRLWGYKSEYSAPLKGTCLPLLERGRQDIGKLVFCANRTKRGKLSTSKDYKKSILALFMPLYFY